MNNINELKNIKNELEDIGLFYQVSNQAVFDIIDNGKWTFYCGFDPTASSLHLWNFIGFMVAVHLMRRGNKYIALTGWATGMIGDPSGKDSERNFLSSEDLKNNEQAIEKQTSAILTNLESFTGEKFQFDFVNNRDFYEGFGYLDFLRDVWKYITVNVMMSKDNVKKRIEDPSQSISYTEFSYMLLQWYDFCKLHTNEWVNFQIWWSDQWGNLVTGTELIRKKYDDETYALTWPLITDSNGKKFGKSEWNALFLDKELTSPYKIYQYFMNSADDDIEKFLKMLTLIDVQEIDIIIKDHMKNPGERKWQKLLAFHVVEIIHWGKDAQVAQKISELLFWKGDKIEILQNLNKDEIESFFLELWGFIYGWEKLFETIVKSGLAKSNWEARQAVQSWAIHIGEEKIEDFQYDISDKFLSNGVLLVRKWKKNFRIIKK